MRSSCWSQFIAHTTHIAVHLLVDRADSGGLWTVPILGEPRYKEKPPAPFLSFLEILGSPVSSPVLSPDLWDLWTCSILCSWKSPSSVNLGQILVSTFYHLIQFFHPLPFHLFLLLHLLHTLPLLPLLPLSSTPSHKGKDRTVAFSATIMSRAAKWEKDSCSILTEHKTQCARF